MDDSLQARMQHEIAELRAAYPRITGCHAALDEWREGADSRYALRLDIRWPQHQSLISGAAKADAYAALHAAFAAARRRGAALRIAPVRNKNPPPREELTGSLAEIPGRGVNPV